MVQGSYAKGVVPAHSYPYPGQYRIQILADTGFDNLRLGDVVSTITLLDQWAPQVRPAAVGDGFTGTDLNNMFVNQNFLLIACI